MYSFYVYFFFLRIVKCCVLCYICLSFIYKCNFCLFYILFYIHLHYKNKCSIVKSLNCCGIFLIFVATYFIQSKLVARQCQPLTSVTCNASHPSLTVFIRTNEVLYCSDSFYFLFLLSLCLLTC